MSNLDCLRVQGDVCNSRPNSKLEKLPWSKLPIVTVVEDFNPISAKSICEPEDIFVPEEAPVSTMCLIVYRNGTGCWFDEMPTDIASFRSNERKSLKMIMCQVLLE